MAKKKTKSPRSKTARAKREVIEENKPFGEFEGHIHEPYQGDESEVQWDDEGRPRPGTAWGEAMDHAEKLKQKQKPKASHLGVRKVYQKLEIRGAPALLHFLTDEKNPRRGKFIRLDEVTRAEWENFEIEQPFLLEGRLRMHQTVEECGRALVLAYLNKDHGFFDELARVARWSFGAKRKKAITNEEVIIERAVELWHDWQGNPSREAVIHEVKRSGIVIRSKDWPAYFKRCKLDFLKSSKGPGRPRKPEPSGKVLIENPKGVFTAHKVSLSEALRLKRQAKQEMRLRAEAEDRGEEYIPF